MKKLLLGGLIAVLALLLYVMFTFIFARFFQVVSDIPLPATPTPAPTFTPTATITPLAISQATPEPPTPTLLPSSPTPTPVLSPTPQTAPTEAPTEASTAAPPASPQIVAASTVNVRAGPGTNYPVVASLPPGVSLAVTGRNGDGSWWQVQHQGQTAWVAASVVEATAVDGVAVAQAPPPPPPPTPTPAPAEPTRPAYQYEPTGWYGAKNLGLTRFFGTITDANGDPVNGATVEAQCGTYRVISNPSGPVPGFGRSDSMTDPPGFYDITIDRKPVPCKWFLTVVHTEDGQTVLAQLSERVEVEVTVEQSIITANWRKNW